MNALIRTGVIERCEERRVVACKTAVVKTVHAGGTGYIAG